MDWHPMAEAYLADLDRALTGSDRREHIETMSAVREHLADVATPDAAPEQVRRALDDLGPVETIAASATRAAVPQSVGGLEAGVGTAVNVGGSGVRAGEMPARASGTATGALTAAVAGAILLLPAPLVGVPLAVVALVVGIASRGDGGRSRRLAWAAVAIAAMTLTATLVLALALLTADTEIEQNPVRIEKDPDPVPAETAPSNP